MHAVYPLLSEACTDRYTVPEPLSVIVTVFVRVPYVVAYCTPRAQWRCRATRGYRYDHFCKETCKQICIARRHHALTWWVRSLSW